MILGLVSLYYGAEWLVDGAIRVAPYLKISKVVVGLVLVAFGTSSPELFVNIIAAINGRTGLALSNVSGSNLTNLCVGFGLCAIVGTLVVNKKTFGVDLIYFALTPLLVLLFMILVPGPTLPLWSAMPLVGLFILYLTIIGKRPNDDEAEETTGKRSFLLGFILFLIGCGALYGGGELVVRNAVSIGAYLGISETILGLTVVAFGTSIPDTVASIAAVRKNETDIAVGNLLGSNIFNILLILGSTLLVAWQGLTADPGIVMDYTVVTILSILFVGLVLISKNVHRLSGGFLILVYLAYMVYRVSLVMMG